MWTYWKNMINIDEAYLPVDSDVAIYVAYFQTSRMELWLAWSQRPSAASIEPKRLQMWWEKNILAALLRIFKQPPGCLRVAVGLLKWLQVWSLSWSLVEGEPSDISTLQNGGRWVGFPHAYSSCQRDLFSGSPMESRYSDGLFTRQFCG